MAFHGARIWAVDKAFHGARFWSLGSSPLGAGRVSIVDVVEVSCARKLGLRRWSRGGAMWCFALDFEVVQNLAYRFWLRDRGQDLHAPLALRACQRVCHEHAFKKEGPWQSAASLCLGDIALPEFADARLVVACRFGARSLRRERRWRCRHHLVAILGGGTEDAVVSDEMAARGESTE
jgi:hypothetical protein